MIVINEVLKSKKYTENFNVCLIGSIASQVNEVGNAYYGLSKKKFWNIPPRFLQKN